MPTLVVPPSSPKVLQGTPAPKVLAGFLALWSPQAPTDELTRRRRLRQRHHLQQGLLSFVLVPTFPLAGYWLLDATGVTAWIAQLSPVLHQIMGEGFGHVGLCFSLHYVIEGVKHLRKAFGRG